MKLRHKPKYVEAFCWDETKTMLEAMRKAGIHIGGYNGHRDKPGWVSRPRIKIHGQKIWPTINLGDWIVIEEDGTTSHFVGTEELSRLYESEQDPAKDVKSLLASMDSLICMFSAADSPLVLSKTFHDAVLNFTAIKSQYGDGPKLKITKFTWPLPDNLQCLVCRGKGTIEGPNYRNKGTGLFKCPSCNGTGLLRDEKPEPEKL